LTKYWGGISELILAGKFFSFKSKKEEKKQKYLVANI
jgi:hypothetical protein